jgi:hypothetical protein
MSRAFRRFGVSGATMRDRDRGRPRCPGYGTATPNASTEDAANRVESVLRAGVDYPVRQMALLPTPSGTASVAIAAQPASGTHDDGVANLTEVAQWLTEHEELLPAGECAAS